LILVLASRVDGAAGELVAAFPRDSARLLTCRDLSRRGWRLSTSSPTQDRIVAAGRRVEASRVDGVVTLLPCVFPAELVHIVPADREYVAAEMTATLLYWLSGLRCAVLNRPTSGSLSGPAWRAERWCRVAREHGFAVRSPRRTTRSVAAYAGALRTLTVVGSRVIGSDLAALHGRAVAMTTALGIDLLQLYFTLAPGPPAFLTASPIPDMSSPIVRSAIVDYFAATRA